MDDLSNIADPSDPAEPRAPVDPATESPDLLKQAVDQALRAQRAQVVYAARNTTAAQANEQQRISYLTGLPVATVRAYPDYARLKAERDQFDAMSYTSPLSAAWLTEPGNYAVARDSLDGMAGVEAQVRPSFWSHPIDWAKDLFTSDATDPNKRTVGAGESFGRGFVQAGNEAAKLVPIVGAGFVGLLGKTGLVGQGAVDAMQEAYFEKAYQLQGYAEDAAINPRAERQDFTSKLSGAGGSLTNALPQYLSGENLAGKVAWVAGERVVAPLLGEAMIASAKTLPQKAAAYTVNALERSAAASSLPATASAVNTAQRVLDSGHSGGDAALAGFGDFVGQVLTNAAPLGFSKGGRLVRAAQAVPAGIAASAVANEISNATLPDGMQHDADGASLLAGGLLPAIMQMFHAGPVSLRAQQEFVEGQRAQVLAAIEKQADAMPLKQQNLSAFENWINRMWPDGTVSASTKDVAALFQSEKIGEGLTDLGVDADGWNEAVATGTDVEIPLARYLSRLTPEQRDSLRGSSRFLPSGGFVDAPMVSRADVEAAIAEVMAADKAGSLGPREDGALGDIYDSIYGQLQPLRGDKEAQVGAQVVQSIYKRVSAMTGIDPAALHDMYRFNLGDGKTPVAQADAQVDPLILAAHSGFRFDEASLYGSSLIPDVIRLGGIRPDSVGAGDLRAADAHLRPGLLNKGGLTAERMAETLAERFPEWAVRFKDVDSYGRPGHYELVDMIRDELQGNKAYSVPVDQKAQDRLTKRLWFNEYAAAVAQAFEKHNVGASADGSPLAKDLPIERQREIARSAFANPEEFDPALMQGLHDPNEAPNDRDVAQLMEQFAGKEGAPTHEAVAEAIKQFRDTEKALGGREAFDKAQAAGKTKLNYAQWVQVRTENFKRWFGDWEIDPANASKVVHPDTGEPLVVYHGTDGDFDTFRDDRPAYFTPRVDYGHVARGSSVLPAFLDIRNPYRPNTKSEIEQLRSNPERVAELRASGHDGMLWSNPHDIMRGASGWGDDLPQIAAFRPEQIKSATANVGTFDEHTANTLFQTAWHGTPHRGIERFSLQKIGTGEGNQAFGWGLYQGKQDQKSSKHPRGQIVFRRADGRLEMDISLLAGADKSTFFHEAAHGFMEMIGALVQSGKASPELAGYFDTLLKHGNAPGEDAASRAAWWHATALEGRRDAHEAVAQGFEQYLLTGKAPSPSLRRAFNALKAWMTTLYRSIAGLGKPINAEVRNVFDRLLASEDEINAMRRSFHLDSLLDQAKDLPADVADRVRKLFGDANADADAALTAQLLANERADVRRAMKAERAEMTRQAEAELKDSPVYRAISWLRNGKLPDGTDAPHPMKLDKQALVDERGPEWVQKNLRGMYAENGGLEPDHAAAVLGFSSGSEMVHAIVNTPKLRDAAKAQADARMRALYPDPLTDGKLPDRAAIAAHREKTFRALVAEINALEGHGRGGMRTHLEVLRAAVKETMARKVLSDVQPHRYRIAEQAAARQAFEAASRQSWDKALEARRRQLLNALLYRAAMDAHAKVGKARTYLAKVNKNKARAKIGKAEGGFLEAQDALLAAIGLRPETDATKATRAALALWLEARHEEGYAIDIPDSVLAGETSKPAKQLTVGQWGDVRDAVKSIRYNADNVNKLRLGKQVRDRKEVDAQVAKAIREGAGKHSRADYRGDPEFRDRLRQVMLEYRASIGAPASLISEMEGFRELGALTEHVMNVIRDANAKLVPLERSEFENSRKLWLEHYSQKEIGALDKPMWIEELGEHWSKRRILNLLQNWGNEGNRKAILSQKSHRLSEADVAELFKRLDARDAKFVQARWDHLEKFAPELDAYHKRMTGLRMKRVEPSPFSFIAKDGTEVSLRGGYFRLHYDPRKSVRGYQVVKDAFDELNSAGTAKAKVSDKQTIERKKSGGLVVDLAIDHFDADIRSTLRVIHMAESVNYVWRALHGSDVRDAFREANKITYHQALTLWLQDVAVGEVVPRNGIDNTLRALRSNIVPMYMAFTILKTPFHYSSLAVTAGRVGMANTLSAIKRYAMSPRKMREYIDSVSPMMGLRETQISETIQRYAQATDGRYKRGRDGMVKAGMFLLVRVWAQVDRISWLAAEAEGLRKFNDVDKARRYADSIVEATQGSSQFIEKSALRRGTLGDKARQSEMVKSLTTMMSFLCARGDLLYRLGYITLGELRNPGFTKAKARAVMNAASSFLMIVTVEGMIYAMSNKGVPTSVQELAQDALDSTAGDTFGSFMGVRDIYAALGGHVQQTPWATLLDNFTKGGQALRAKKFNDVAVRKAAISTAGSLTGFPSSQVNKTLSALDEVRAGRKIELTELLTGHKKKKN